MSYHVAINDAIALYLKQSNLAEEKLAEMMSMPVDIFRQKRCGDEEFTLLETIKLSGILGMTLDEVTGISKTR